jgi:hypothetical protein
VHSSLSRLTGYDRKTGKLEAFKALSEGSAAVGNARMLLRELRERDYGGYTILTDSLRPQWKETPSVAGRRFETPPGTQVDWGHLGSIAENGEVGSSRRMMAEAATDQKPGTPAAYARGRVL